MDGRKRARGSDKEVKAKKAKKRPGKTKSKKEKPQRFVIVCENSYIVFGPYLEGNAEAHLKSRGYMHSGLNVWTCGTERVFVRQVKRLAKPAPIDQPIEFPIKPSKDGRK